MDGHFLWFFLIECSSMSSGFYMYFTVVQNILCKVVVTLFCSIFLFRKRVVSLRQPHLDELSMTGGTVSLAEPVTITNEDRELYSAARNLAGLVSF